MRSRIEPLTAPKPSDCSIEQTHKNPEDVDMCYNPHNRAGGQPTSQVGYCHVIRMHCVCVVKCVKTLGLSPPRSLGVWAFTSLALHSSKQK